MEYNASVKYRQNVRMKLFSGISIFLIYIPTGRQKELTEVADFGNGMRYQKTRPTVAQYAK